MYDAQPRPERIGTNIIVMRCPECRELVMLHASQLQMGKTVRCCHCRATSSISAEAFPDGTGCYWNLRSAP